MDLLQFNEDYTDNHTITTFPSAPHVASPFVQATRLSAWRRSKQDKRNANNGIALGIQEDIYQTQQVTFNERLVNATTFETGYLDFAPLKFATEAVFVES